MQGITESDERWASSLLQKLDEKFSAQAARLGERIPYLTRDGVYREDMAKSDVAWWTNGFWGGILWQMTHAVSDRYMPLAQKQEELLDRALDEYENLYHDVGFMWMTTAVANWRKTGNKRSYVRGQHAANLLAGRFNPLGNYIRAWNGDMSGWIIIDCMMNLSLLYWASEESGDPRFAAIATRHADTALKYLVREDGSCNHIGILNDTTGELIATPAGQGYAAGSSWTRGQAWAIYGFAISYAHTKDEKYLNAAKRVAHYFLANVAQSDYRTPCDFRAPDSPAYYDDSASACAACGLLQIARHVPTQEQALYNRGAVRLLRALTDTADFDLERDGVLQNCKVRYHDDLGQVNLIYADYFYTEGILRLLDKHLWIW